MSAARAQPVLATPAPAWHQARWIISRNEDITWFIGSAGISFLALALMAGGFPVHPLMLVWLLLIDGPHVVATVTRTYFDKQERAKLGALLWWLPLPMLAIGPAMVAAGQYAWFFLFAVCWQHFHIAKQHFGFVMLYKAKNGERDAKDLRLDKWLLLSSLWAPMIVFIVRTRDVAAAWAPVDRMVPVIIAAYAVLVAAWLWRQVEKLRGGVAINLPKIALLVTVIPLQWIALLHASHYGPEGIVRAGIALGLFHSFQYHRLLWFHNRNRYSANGAGERYGLASSFVSSAVFYVVLVVALHFLLMVLPRVVFPGDIAAAAVWGFSFTHYVLDSKIWRVRGDQELAVALRLRTN
ncbi:MAG: hypothetical protein ABI972_18625 [Acidobacteriota bacterium]